MNIDMTKTPFKRCPQCNGWNYHLLSPTCECPAKVNDPRIFGSAKVGSEAVPQPPSKRFKGGVVTPHGDVSFHSEYEAARDYIWDAVSDKLVRERAAVNNKGPHQ